MRSARAAKIIVDVTSKAMPCFHSLHSPLMVNFSSSHLAEKLLYFAAGFAPFAGARSTSSIAILLRVERFLVLAAPPIFFSARICAERAAGEHFAFSQCSPFLGSANLSAVERCLMKSRFRSIGATGSDWSAPTALANQRCSR